MSKNVAIKKAQKATDSTTQSVPAASKSTSKAAVNNKLSDLVSAINTTYSDYTKTLTPRLKLIDLFLAFLVALGILQFIYVLLVGNFPFNAFLGGFISCVGQFVLVVSLRLQVKDTKGENETLFEEVSPERAFGDFVFASLILHFVVYHFIN